MKETRAGPSRRSRWFIRASSRVALAYLCLFGWTAWPGGSGAPLVCAASNASVGVSVTVSNGPPDGIRDLTGQPGGAGAGSLTLTWTEPGASGNSGQAASYLIRYSTASNISDDTDFTGAAALSAPGITPGVAGGARTEVIEGLCPGETYYWAIKAENHGGSRGPWSRSGGANANNFAAAPLAAVSSLSATGSDGRVILNWTPGAVCRFSSYRIYRDTFTAPTTTLAEITSSGTTTYADTTVTNGESYHYRIETFTASLSSATASVSVTPNAAALPQEPIVLSTATFGVSNSEIQFAWAQPTPPSVTGFRLKEPSGSILTSDLLAGTTRYVATGLKANQLLKVIIQAYNAAGTADSAAVQKYALANPPSGSEIVSTGGSSIEVKWSSNNNQGTPTYEVLYGTNESFTGAATKTTTSTSLTLSGLNGGSKYYIKVRALNGDGVATAYDSTLSATTGTSGSTGRPAAPAGLRVASRQISGDEARIVLAWEAVKTDASGEALASAPTYLVRVAEDFPTGDTWSGAESTSAAQYTVSSPKSATRYMAVRAVGAQGDQSDLSMIFKWPDESVITPTDDTTSRLELPLEANEAMLEEGLTYVASVVEKEDAAANVVKAIELKVVNSTTGKTVADFVYPKPGRIILGYTVQGNQVIKGSAKSARGQPVVEASKAKQQLALFWYNGAKWIKMGGDVDTDKREVSFWTKRIGQFQVRQAIRLGDLTLVQVYPRIITPNGDGKNDTAIFQFGEGTLAGVDLKGEIFDITGAKVADLQAGPDPSTSLAWDGKDSGGRTCPSGIYIYQIELGGNRTNGTVVVAR